MVFPDGTGAGARRHVATMGFASHAVRGRWFMFFASILIMHGGGGRHVHLRHLLQGDQDVAGVRPADAQHAELLQGRGRQRGHPPRTHQRGHPAVSRPGLRRGHESRRLPHDLPVRHHPHGAPARVAHVRLHRHRRQLAVLRQHWRTRHRRQELPRGPGRRAGPPQGLRGPQRRHLHAALPRHLRRRHRRRRPRAAHGVAPRRHLAGVHPDHPHHTSRAGHRGGEPEGAHGLLLLPLRHHRASRVPARDERGGAGGPRVPQACVLRHGHRAAPPHLLPARHRRPARAQELPPAATADDPRCSGSDHRRRRRHDNRHCHRYRERRADVYVGVVLRRRVPAAGEGGRLHDPAGAVQRGHAGAVRGHHLRRGRHADGDRQHGPDRSVPGVPAAQHLHARLPGEHLDYAGRVVAGFASEHVLSRYKVPRPLVLTAVLLVACSGHLLIALGVNNGLYPASVILGFCFGAQWPLLFAIISEVFGLKYYSTLYNFGAVASPVRSYILNVRIAGRKYDEEALRQGGRRGKGLTCIGVRCFQESYIIAGMTLLGALVSLVLAWRTRKFYRGDLYGKFKEVGMATGSAGCEGMQEAANGAGAGAGTAKDPAASGSDDSKIGSTTKYYKLLQIVV